MQLSKALGLRPVEPPGRGRELAPRGRTPLAAAGSAPQRRELLRAPALPSLWVAPAPSQVGKGLLPAPPGQAVDEGPFSPRRDRVAQPPPWQCEPVPGQMSWSTHENSPGLRSLPGPEHQSLTPGASRCGLATAGPWRARSLHSCPSSVAVSLLLVCCAPSMQMVRVTCMPLHTALVFLLSQ